MSFSGHGYTDQGGKFYLLPSDFVGSCRGIDERTLTSAISSDELAEGCAQWTQERW
jgi:hypothetical protein